MPDRFVEFGAVTFLVERLYKSQGLRVVRVYRVWNGVLRYICPGDISLTERLSPGRETAWPGRSSDPCFCSFNTHERALACC